MTIRKRNSPGIELNEIDHSQYDNKPDYSTIGTTTFICGFADKGYDYLTEWINSIKTLDDTFGLPTNEVERYFYNSGIEILSKGGVLLMTKLPYKNDSKDKFAYVDYHVSKDIKTDENDDDIYISALSTVDKTLTSYIEISACVNDDENKLIDLSIYDGYKTHERVLPADTFRIVDITRKRYDSISMLSSNENDSRADYRKIVSLDKEFIGIMPVVVSPLNAMYFLQIIEDKTEVNTSGSLSGQETSLCISEFNAVANATNRSNDSLSDFMQPSVFDDNFLTVLAAKSINDESVSKTAALYFPDISYLTQSTLSRKYLKDIGIVVFNVFKDVANSKKLNFSPVEAFVGSLDHSSKDIDSKQTKFIDDIVNSSSKLINLFSNVRIDNTYKNASTLLVHNLSAKILGFKRSECVKNIDYKDSIIEPLTKILEANKDPNIVNIDLVCDAGVSNIALFVYSFGSYESSSTDESSSTSESSTELNLPLKYNADVYPNVWSATQSEGLECRIWKISDGNSAWKTVLKKYDSFCRLMRKDCMFLADVLRPFCLAGNLKIVRRTNLANTIENSIIPNLNSIIALNSSYSAGYSDWFYIKDYISNDFMWLPPSVKAAGVCNYIDTYFHLWDAPAGTLRGAVNDAYDVAFSPQDDEAGKIYLHSWNYAVNYPIDGITIEGQKTFLLEKTALDRINVRRLMLYLEKRVRNVAHKFMYEGNTQYTRQRFIDTIQPIFEDVKNSYGISEYAIKCDDTNNTAKTIENNELRCIIAVKPVKTIEWIVCDFIVTNLSANVVEEVMKS